MKGRISKWGILGASVSFVVVFLAMFLTVRYSNVLGKNKINDPYVVGTPEPMNIVLNHEGYDVTSENQKDQNGSNSPVCTGVPKCEGPKGSETNPFVILEIVPDLAEQQMTYFAGSKEDGLPFDPAEVSAVISAQNTDKSKSFRSNNSLNDLGVRNALGYFATEDKYEVYEIPEKPLTEGQEPRKLTGDDGIPLIEKKPLFEYNITPDNLAAASGSGVNIDNFHDDVLNFFNENNTSTSMNTLIENYPALFPDTQALSQAVSTDKKNYELDLETPVRTVHGGYLIITDQGAGDFYFGGDDDFRDRHNVDGNDKKGIRYKYVQTLPADKIDVTTRQSDVKNNININDNSNEYTGYYYPLDQNKDYNIPGAYPDEMSYHIRYWGLYFNDILKRALFKFKSKEEYENFHMKVIAMTPKEINKISKEDTDNTKVDMVERADMFFISDGAYSSGFTDAAKRVYPIYKKFVQNDSSVNVSDDNYMQNHQNDIKTFHDLDLEWDQCMKIIKRASENVHLPVVFTKTIGEILAEGVEQNSGRSDYLCMSLSKEGAKYNHKPGSINNISKLYLILNQFNLFLAKSSGDEGVSRTFMSDIYTNIKTIRIAGTQPEGSAQNTGYYERPISDKCETHPNNTDNLEYLKRANYLWNAFTFWPSDWDIDTTPEGNLVKTYIDLAPKQGYNMSYFDTLKDANQNLENLTQSSPYALGRTDINMTETNEYTNMTVIGNKGEQAANTNMSGFINPTGGNAKGHTSYYMSILYEILNAKPFSLSPVTVTVEKKKSWYTKISDTSVLIDERPDAKYKTDIDLYLKVSVQNSAENNKSGAIKSVKLINDDPAKKDITLPLLDFEGFKAKPYTKNALKKVDIGKNENPPDSDTIHGYEVASNLTVCVPYTRSQWIDGYRTVRFITTARSFNSETSKIEHGKDIPTDITIAERELFDLQ